MALSIAANSVSSFCSSSVKLEMHIYYIRSCQMSHTQSTGFRTSDQIWQVERGINSTMSRALCEGEQQAIIIIIIIIIVIIIIIIIIIDMLNVA